MQQKNHFFSALFLNIQPKKKRRIFQFSLISRPPLEVAHKDVLQFQSESCRTNFS